MENISVGVYQRVPSFTSSMMKIAPMKIPHRDPLVFQSTFLNEGYLTFESMRAERASIVAARR